MGGTTGNKGTVGISLTYNATSFVFLCSHFAAGQKEIQERNNDFGEALKKLAFANVSVLRSALIYLKCNLSIFTK